MAIPETLGDWLVRLIKEQRPSLGKLSEATKIPPHILQEFGDRNATVTLPLPNFLLLLKYLYVDPSQVLLPLSQAVWLRKPTFGATLRLLREASGFTQQQAAQAAGLPYQSYVQYEQGRRTPVYPAVVAVAKALGVSADYFADCSFEEESEQAVWKAPLHYYPEPQPEEPEGPEPPAGRGDPIPF